MTASIEQLARRITEHRCYRHPIFDNWAQVDPSTEVLGALFHQIQSFCAATRPAGRFPDALQQIGLEDQSALMQEIADSETHHGAELARMAGHIVNRSAGTVVCTDLDDQEAVESTLKAYSNRILGTLPGYDVRAGLTTQARRAIAVFAGRDRMDADSTYRNLGTTVALEMISNRHLIPGEKHCLIDSGLYQTRLDDPAMHYLLEHWGEVGAEQHHEHNAQAAIASLDGGRMHLVVDGADQFLDALTDLWDLLSASLLQSGHAERRAPARASHPTLTAEARHVP